MLKPDGSAPRQGADVDSRASAVLDGVDSAIGGDVVDEDDVPDAVDRPVDRDVARLEVAGVGIGEHVGVEVL